MNRMLWLTSLAAALLGPNVMFAQVPIATAGPSEMVMDDEGLMGGPVISTGPHGGGGSYGPYTPSPGGAMPGYGQHFGPTTSQGTPAPGTHGAPIPGEQPGISDWLAYPRTAACCGPIGGDGPIVSEFYWRIGASQPFGEGVLARTAHLGLHLESGLRTLLYNVNGNSAWVIDLGLSNSQYNMTSTQSVTLRNPNGSTTNVIPGGLNQTFFNAGLGRQWYLMGGGRRQNGNVTWRSGCDVIGKWGTEKLDIVRGRHRTDVIGGVGLAAFTDFEYFCGCCVFTFGARVEYGFVWSDVLQSHNDADLNYVNVMFTGGVKF